MDPKHRIYLPGLLNWVQFEDARQIRGKAPKVWEAIHVPTEYSEQALAQAVDPTFNQPPLYKHYFKIMGQEFDTLASMGRGERIAYLQTRVSGARQAYLALEKANILLERHGRGGHLPAWADYLSGLKA